MTRSANRSAAADASAQPAPGSRTEARASRGAPAAAGAQRVPDFFIVGHPKSGTSALFQMLRSHPQLHMPRKEPSFFVPELWPAGWDKLENGIADYLALFADATPDQLIGEATTSYLWSSGAAARIAEAQPDARIIAILREPADFLRSLHLQFVRSNVENEYDLRAAIELDRERAEGRRLPPNSTRPQALVYADHVRYVEQLRRYEAAFGRDRMLILIYEDFRADNGWAVAQVLRFLGVAEDGATVEPIEANRATGVRSPRAHDLLRSVYLGRSRATKPLKGAIKAVTPRRMRHRAVAAANRLQRSSPPALDSSLMRELRRRFRPEVESLSDYLGRDLVSFWGYESD
jgi:hypothetical protein